MYLHRLFAALILIAVLASASAQFVKPIPVSEVSGATKVIHPYKNLTRLIIEPKFKYVRLEAGEETSFDVRIKNPTKKDVTIDPKIVIPPYTERVMDEDWIKFSRGKFVLKAGEEATIEVTVKVPKDAGKGSYSCMIAFTNDTFPSPYPTETPRFVNVLHLSVYVWIPPSVKIYPKNIFKYVEAGESYIFNITVENTGDKLFRLDPKLKHEEFYSPDTNYLTKDMVKIEAPSTIPPHSKVKVKIIVNVPSTAKGTLRGYIDLGIDDPGLEDWARRVSINLMVYEKPTEPFVKVFRVENASVLRVKVGTDLSPNFVLPFIAVKSPFESKADVNVRLISPHGEVKVRPKILERMIVTLGGSNPPWEEVEGIYKVVSVSKSYTFEIENPENGVWMVEVMPKGCFMFNVEVEIE